MAGRRAVVAVIGRGDISEDDPIYGEAFEAGRELVNFGFRVMTGGLGGVMEAALKGARTSEKYREGDTIGIIPGNDPLEANEYADIVIPTGLGIARNMIVTNSDAVIAFGGGSGTLSEMAFAWQKKKTIVAVDVGGWSSKLAGTPIDDRRPGDIVVKASSGKEAAAIIFDSMKNKM